jgi:MFS transporter, ACS family, solute carrier family 17 (sodium-dependent inorganic phosphate cotransporter), other
VAALFGSNLGTAFTFPLMGYITENYSWQSAFYVTAFITFVVSLLWFHIVADSPDKHRAISHAERNLIEESLQLNVVVASKKEFPPVSEMLRSKPFYALLGLHFSDVWGIYFILTSAPMFMSQVLDYNLKDVGVLSSLPYLIRLIGAVIFGGIGDWLWTRKIMSATGIRKFFCLFCE